MSLLRSFHFIYVVFVEADRVENIRFNFYSHVMASWKVILLVAILFIMILMCLSADGRVIDKHLHQKENDEEDKDKVARGAVGALICPIIISLQAASYI